MGKYQIEARLDEMCNLLNISHLMGRYPKDLSGGERQRVALARAIAPSPRILLLDEPFNNLDIKTRKYLRLEFKRILKGIGLTTIFVTHDFKEAEEMGDRIAVIDSGRLEQIATPREIFFSPNGDKVADFLGSPNIFDCDNYEVLGNGLVKASCEGLTIIMVWDGEKLNKIAISPDDIYVSRNEPSGPPINRFRGTIIEEISCNSVVTIKIKTTAKDILVRIGRKDFIAEGMKVGSDVFFILPLRNLRGV